MLRLDTHDTTAPALPDIFVTVVELATRVLTELGEVCFILCADGRKSNGSCGLLVHHGTKTGLALHDTVRDVHLATKCGQPDHQLNWVDIMGDYDHCRLLRLDQFNNMVDSKLQTDRLLRRGRVFASILGLRHGAEALLFLELGLWLVLRHEPEHGVRRRRIAREAELIDGRRDFEALQQNLALALQAYILRPFDVPREIDTLWKDVLANTEVLRPLLEQRIHRCLLDVLAGCQWSSSGRAPLAFLSSLYVHDGEKSYAREQVSTFSSLHADNDNPFDTYIAAPQVVMTRPKQPYIAPAGIRARPKLNSNMGNARRHAYCPTA